MRKYTKTGEKRYSVLRRKGFFTRPVLVHETVESRRKKSNLAGKVLKPHKPLMTPAHAAETKAKVIEYISLLGEAGVLVHPTKIVIIPTKVRGKVQLNFVQDLIPKHFILNSYLKYCSKEEAISAFTKTLNIFEKIKAYSKPGRMLGIDSSLINLAVVNGKIVLIDIYPPFIKNKFELTGKEHSREMRNPLFRWAAKTFPTIATRLANRVVDSRFDMPYRRSELLRHFSRARPELRSELEQIIGLTHS